ncbi:MAG: hypothetical protein HKN47_23150 [Pirellulaceae bacterium]|nr:hypothetical protein [Pirellulaceae bacterium]
MTTNSLTARTDFYAKTWYLNVAAVVFTCLGGFSALFRPLFLFEIMKRADGQSGTEAGTALSIMAIPLVLVAILAWFNVYARRKPLLRICKEGIEVNIIGASSLDGVPLIPTMVRVAWLILSGQGFKQQIGWISWNQINNVQISGLPGVRSLVIDASLVKPVARGEKTRTLLGSKINFRDAELRDPLESVAGAIWHYHHQPAARQSLTSLYS